MKNYEHYQKSYDIFSTSVLHLYEKRRIGFWLEVEKSLSKTTEDTINNYRLNPYKLLSKKRINESYIFVALANMMVSKRGIYIYLDALNGEFSEEITSGSEGTAIGIYSAVLWFTTELLKTKYEIYHKNLTKKNSKKKIVALDELIEKNIKLINKLKKNRMPEVKKLFVEAIKLRIILYCCQQVTYKPKRELVILNDAKKRIVLHSPITSTNDFIQFGQNAINGPIYTAGCIEEFSNYLLEKQP